MANNPHFLEATRNTALQVVNTDLGASPLFRIYAGVQPANANAAVTAANVVVAELAMAATAFSSAASGVMTADVISDDASAAGGTAAWFALVKATGLRIADGSVGTSGADVNLNAVAITTGAAVSISAFTVTFAE